MHVKKYFVQAPHHSFSTEGRDDDEWMLLDIGYCVVHMFTAKGYLFK